MSNLLLNTDSYKLSHFRQYPPDTTRVNAYIESRGGRFPETVFFGLQAFVKEYLLRPITAADVEEYLAFAPAHGLPVNEADARYLLDVHGGYLPLHIEAAPEGSVIPTGNVLVQVMNTDPRLFWLTTYIETALLRAIWYPSTVATLSRTAKVIIERALRRSSDDPAGQLPFKLHDFGARGASSEETAALGGMAHLVNFMGSDTISGILAARRYYGAAMAGFSIPASEHSTITAWGRDGEAAAYTNLLSQFGRPGGLLACVSDSYDLMHAVGALWGSELREQVKTMGGTLVVRPDSGDPVTTPIATIELLMDRFGYTTNQKGYRVLPDYLRVIQGDGMNLDTIEQLLTTLLDRGIAADNIAFGMGAGLLQQVDRDTGRFAMKASAIEVNGVWRDIQKDPATDPSKRSKAGRLALVHECGLGSCGYRTLRAEEAAHQPTAQSVLRTVYQDGQLLADDSFDTIRERAAL